MRYEFSRRSPWLTDVIYEPVGTVVHAFPDHCEPSPYAPPLLMNVTVTRPPRWQFWRRPKRIETPAEQVLCKVCFPDDGRQLADGVTRLWFDSPGHDESPRPA